MYYDSPEQVLTWFPGPELVKQRLFVPAETVTGLTIISFLDKIRWKYLPAQDVIWRGKQEWGGEEEAKEREKWPDKRGPAQSSYTWSGALDLWPRRHERFLGSQIPPRFWVSSTKKRTLVGPSCFSPIIPWTKIWKRYRPGSQHRPQLGWLLCVCMCYFFLNIFARYYFLDVLFLK